MATSFLGSSVSPLSVARGAVTLVGGLALLIGTRAVMSPIPYAKDFGFPPESSTGSAAAKNPFIAVSGGRIISSSITILALSYLGYDKALGVVMMAGWVSGIIDGITVINQTDPIDRSKTGEELKREEARVEQAKITGWSHWATVSVFGAIGAYLFVNSEA
jgi:hypothetical protein